MTDRPPATIEQQADLLDYLVGRIGNNTKEAFISLRSEEIEDLKHLARRLRFMAPHEAKIRKLVTGK